MRLLSLMFSTYRIPMTDDLVAGYAFVLQGVPEVDIERAIASLLRSGREFCPNPGQIYQEATIGKTRGLSAKAWNVYEKAQRLVGGEYGVNFRDGLINATVRAMGGWRRCCAIPDEDFHVWHKRDWIATYERFLADGVSEERTRGECGVLPSDFVGNRICNVAVDYEPLVTSDVVTTLPQLATSEDRSELTPANWKPVSVPRQTTPPWERAKD